MTKQKSRGPETDRWCQHAQTPRKRNVAAYGQAIGNGHVRIPSSAQGKQEREISKKKIEV